jgi:hypothetical protein
MRQKCTATRGSSVTHSCVKVGSSAHQHGAAVHTLMTEWGQQSTATWGSGSAQQHGAAFHTAVHVWRQQCTATCNSSAPHHCTPSCAPSGARQHGAALHTLMREWGQQCTATCTGQQCTHSCVMGAAVHNHMGEHCLLRRHCCQLCYFGQNRRNRYHASEWYTYSGSRVEHLLNMELNNGNSHYWPAWLGGASHVTN